MRDEDELGIFIDQARHSLFRLETLDRYDVRGDGGDFRRYLNGEPGPDQDRKAAWHRVLRADRARGVTTRRVHLVRSPLTDYLRFEMEWGYAHNLPFEDIRILDAAERRVPDVIGPVPDFWLVDGADVAIMHYDDEGRFLGFDVVPGTAGYTDIAAAAWDAAEPFAEYWESHPQLRRDSRAA